MTTALALRRCRCGEPIGSASDCGDKRCKEAPWLLNRYVLRLPPPQPSPRTSDAWIADHAHEWEPGANDWPAA